MKIIKTARYKKMAEDYLAHPERYSENILGILEPVRQELLSVLRNDGLVKIDFNDVSAQGIQIAGIHRDYPRYIYLNETVKYDLSNLDEAKKEFINKWKSMSGEEDVDQFGNIVNQSNKWGWD